MADDHSGRCAEKSEGGGICVKTHALIVENQNPVESMLVDKGEFTLGLVEVAASYIPSTNVEKCGASKSEQDGRESCDGQIRDIDALPEDNYKKYYGNSE
jgi:hypothetical protein